MSESSPLAFCVSTQFRDVFRSFFSSSTEFEVAGKFMRTRSGRNSQASMLRALTCARGKQQQQIELRGMKMININTSEEKVLMELSDNNNLIRNIQCCGFFEGVNLCRI
jgi:hypothetical protein